MLRRFFKAFIGFVKCFISCEFSLILSSMAAPALFSPGVAQGNNHKINKGADGGFPQMLLLSGSGQKKISGEFFDSPHGRNLFEKALCLAISIDFPVFSGTFSPSEIGGNELVAFGAAVEAIWMRVLVCASVAGVDLVRKSANHCVVVGCWGGAGSHGFP